MRLKASLLRLSSLLVRPRAHLTWFADVEQIDPFFRREVPVAIAAILLVGGIRGGFSPSDIFVLALTLLTAPLLLIGAVVVLKAIVFKGQLASTNSLAPLLSLAAILSLHISVAFLIGSFFGAHLAILVFLVVEGIFFIAWAPASKNPATSPKWATITLTVLIGTVWTGMLCDTAHLAPGGVPAPTDSAMSASDSSGDTVRALESYPEKVQACVQNSENCGGLSVQEAAMVEDFMRDEMQRFELQRHIAGVYNKMNDDIIEDLRDMSRDRKDKDRR